MQTLRSTCIYISTNKVIVYDGAEPEDIYRKTRITAEVFANLYSDFLIIFTHKICMHGFHRYKGFLMRTANVSGSVGPICIVVKIQHEHTKHFDWCAACSSSNNVGYKLGNVVVQGRTGQI